MLYMRGPAHQQILHQDLPCLSAQVQQFFGALLLVGRREIPIGQDRVR
jgi:hypothetical protein